VKKVEGSDLPLTYVGRIIILSTGELELKTTKPLTSIKRVGAVRYFLESGFLTQHQFSTFLTSLRLCKCIDQVKDENVQQLIS
jgi:hypothetical protein